MKTSRLFIAVLFLVCVSFAQEKNPPTPRVEKTPATPEATRQTTSEEPRHSPAEQKPEQRTDVPRPSTSEPSREGPPTAAYHWDMTEVPPVVTHHEIRLNGRALRYTATTGRLPIKDPSGNIDAEMFFVAYTLDGAQPNTRPVTFAFNGGPGSASIWLHMGAVGPRKVVMQEPEGWMPASPYRLQDNPYTPLDKTDLVLVDAIGTGYSRPADMERAKKFWDVKGDIEAFGEFVRMYISRYERWSSPLYIMGESYGTTRAAGIAGHLIDRGITFNGIALVSMVLDFQTIIFNKHNDEPYILTLPTYTMIAGYHKKLPPELLQDMNKTREEVVRWVSTDYAHALAMGDALTPQQRQAVIDQLARYTGLKKEFIDQANLRIDVQGFTHNLLADEKLRVGRLDGRYKGPDPEGFLETRFYDPASAASTPPFTAVFNDYVRRELNYKIDLPYYVSASQLGGGSPGPRGGGPFRWNFGDAAEGFPETATPLRAAMAKNPYLKILVMEGYYDLATPFFGADYTMNHLDLPAAYRKNISYATYDAGHMMYMRQADHAKMTKDFEAFIDATLPKQ